MKNKSRRDKQAKLTKNERLVYAAAFAVDCARHDRPSDTLSAMASAWVAVLHLRDDTKALGQSIDWERVRAMFRSFAN